MGNDQIDALVNTLLSNKLASSPGEAKKMAEDMLGTAAKVNAGFQNQQDNPYKDNLKSRERPVTQTNTPTSFNSTIQEKNVPSATAAVPPQGDASKDRAMQARIQELRESAINPQPVAVQVDFQTPQQEINEQQAQQQPSQPLPEEQVSVPGLDPNRSLNDLANEAVDTLNTNPVPSGPVVVEEKQAPADNFFQQEAQAQPAPVHQPEPVPEVAQVQAPPTYEAPVAPVEVPQAPEPMPEVAPEPASVPQMTPVPQMPTVPGSFFTICFFNKPFSCFLKTYSSL